MISLMELTILFILLIIILSGIIIIGYIYRFIYRR